MKKYKKYKFRHKETVVTILTEDDKFYKIAVNAILEARKKIEVYIKRDPFFYVTLEPYDCKGEIVERMCKASNLAGVGPMAAVAGVIAQYAVEKMVEAGARFAVIDNGGDIAMYLNRPIVVGLYTYSLTIGLKIEKKGYYAICTSSGTIGHSISFGFADAATIFARDACIADAFATALGNMIKDDFKKEDILETLKNFWERSKNHIEGALVVKDNIIGFIGDIPKFVNAEVNVDIMLNYGSC
ncbi:MAG TPA: UPF0280 family protein [Archaeoglobus profundus]|nr:UPF0280 family protein [Archaeoglobus profundus]HIP58178.1 UPF0280 family protein [Archaeoglobus profundus]